jgi:hypothetical protein
MPRARSADASVATTAGSCYLRAHQVGNDDQAYESLPTLDYETIRTDSGWKIRHFVENILARVRSTEVVLGATGQRGRS